jgi:hypothetical protein
MWRALSMGDILPQGWRIYVRMETLDLGDDDDEVELIQQTQASQAAHALEAMETEASAPMDVTNARSSIAAEGTARSSAAACPSPR